MTIFPTDYTDKWSADSTDKVWSSDGVTNFNLTVDEIGNEVFTDRSTTNLTEGTNQYYTDAKVDARITWKANKTNVLELDNTTAFTPDADYEPATKKYVDDQSSAWSSQIVKVAWEALSEWDVVRIANGSIEMLDIVGWSSSTNGAIWYDTTREALAQSFLTTSALSLSNINCRLKKTGSPTWNLTAKLYTSTDTSGTPVTTSTNTISESWLTTSFVRNSFNFSGFEFTDATTYYMVIETDRANSTSNYSEWGINTSGASYPDGQTWRRETGSTTLVVNVASWDFDIEIMTSENVTKVFKASWLTTSDANVMWIVQSTVLLWENATINIAGIAPSTASLTSGTNYYISDTDGLLSSTAGTVSKLVWTAIDTSTILLKNT